MRRIYNFYVYIMASITKVIYIGVTNDLGKRVAEHQQGKFEGFSKKYRTKRLVYYEHFTDIRYAIQREKELKGWRRSKKIALIESMNPSWHDLSVDIVGQRHEIPRYARDDKSIHKSIKFKSKVIHGQAHGRTIGYPTANLEVTETVREALPQEGVYAVKVRTKDGEYGGALFYGQRSLFADTKPICEVLLLDFAGDLYGEEVEVDVVKYIRPVVAVKSEEELKRLIEEDVKNMKSNF